MNKFVIGALALTSASSLAYAGGSETKEWSTLDRDILSLTSQTAPAAGVTFSGFVRTRGAHSNDVDLDTGPGKEKLSGFTLDNARVTMDLAQGDFGARISLEAVDQDSLAAGTPSNAFLLDAYATARIAEGWMGMIGHFRSPFLGSALIDDNTMLLLDRTFNGQFWDERTDGIQVSGMFDQISIMAALQNGSDQLQNGYMWTGRVVFAPLGTVGNNQEGAYGSSSETAIRLGLAYADDSEISKGDAWAVEGSLVQGGFSLQAELVDYNDDVTPGSGVNLNTGVLNPAGIVATGGSETPWSATAGLLINPNLELVARFEDLDDDDDTTAVTIGANFYAAGHNAKLTVQATRSDSDDGLKEADTLAFGVCVGV